MGTMVSGLFGVVLFIFGAHAVLTQRVMFGDEGEDVQILLYGWRAVAIGLAALALATLCFATISGLVTLDWL
jgi:hypothetical protein